MAKATKSKKSSIRQRFSALSHQQKIAISVLTVAVFSFVGAYVLNHSFASIQPKRPLSQYQLPSSTDGHRMIQTDATLEVITGDAPYYWAMQSSFINVTGAFPTGSLYMGLQNRGSRVKDGSLGKTAVFSIFGATIYGSPGDCDIQQNNFDGYGGIGGTSCRIAYDWIVGRKYTFRASYTGTSNLGRYWSGYIVDTVTGVSTKIADINIPNTWSNGLNSTPVVWLEYFAFWPNTCAEIPVAQVRFTNPTSDHGPSTGDPANYLPSGAECTNATYTNGNGYVVQRNGTATSFTVPGTSPTPTTDTTKPSPPTTVNATANAYNKATVVWSGASDNVGIKKYYVVRNSATIAALGNVDNYVDTSVAASKTYSYSIIAEDAAGNKSSASVIKSVTTPAAPVSATALPTTTTTTLAPPSNPLLSAVNYNNSNIWWYVRAKWTPPTNTTGITGYKVEVLKNGSLVQSQNLSASATGADIKNLAQGGYLLKVYSVGNNGLQSAAVSKPFTTTCQSLFWVFTTCTVQ